MGTAHGNERAAIAGRYLLFDEVGTGGMASVYIGRLIGPSGFSRTVAIKRLHPHVARDPEFVGMFLDEARLAACVRHPNVASILDVVHTAGDLLLVLEYVSGESLSQLRRTVAASKETVPVAVAVATLTGALQGLHAAHEATGPSGEPLGLIHRDVSPQNIMVGDDGIARIIDFGVAKAAGRVTATREGHVKGKAGYMAPEQLMGGEVDRRVDIFAASVVLWETLTGERLFLGQSDAETVLQVLERSIPPASKVNPNVPAALDAVVARGLRRAKGDRYATALEMAAALEAAVRPATTREVAEWVRHAAGPALLARNQRVLAIESDAGASAHTGLPAAEMPTHTQVNTVSASRPGPKRSHTVWLSPAFFALALAFAIAAAAVYRERSAVPGTAAAHPPQSPASQVPAALSEGAPTDPAFAPDATANNAAEASLDAGSPRHRPAQRRPSPRPDCTPPYTLDPSGYHVPKPACL
jgi:serine/threonine protein kinase